MAIRLAILISGRGSNMRAILQHFAHSNIEFLVVANRPDAKGLNDLAQMPHLKLMTAVVESKKFPNRNDFDQALHDCLAKFAPDFVLLAGFMRVLGAAFVRAFEGRLINIHPALLPAFPGLDTHKRALAAGVLEHGSSVHWVSLAVDEGGVIVQAPVQVLFDDTEETLADRVLKQEHIIYPQVVSWLISGELRWVEGASTYSPSILEWCEARGYRLAPSPIVISPALSHGLLAAT